MRPLYPGGRIKSAAVGLDYLYGTDDADDIVAREKRLRSLRENPPEELRKAFFPTADEHLPQMLRGVGFYRPMLKTDQGMGGNFFPFVIESTLERTDLGQRTVHQEEIMAVEELWYPHKTWITAPIHLQLSRGNTNAARDLVGAGQRQHERREATKGRLPFFFIRPALLDRYVKLGDDVMQTVPHAVERVATAIEEKACELQWNYSKGTCPFQPNTLYCQPDVFILADGKVVIEKMNYPDVGLFLSSLTDPFEANDSALSHVRHVVRLLEKNVCAAILKHVETRNIAVVTRDEVILRNEDVLEIREIERLQYLLLKSGREVHVYPLSEVPDIPHGSSVLLMNIDYRADGAKALLARHCRGELLCYPNPFIQIASKSISGLEERVIDPKYRSSFLKLIGSLPKDDLGLRATWQRIEKVLFQNGITSDIVYADIGPEVVPIFRRSLHSWRQLKNRIERYPDHDKLLIRLRLIPATPDNLLIRSTTGSRLHSFRFMFIA